MYTQISLYDLISKKKKETLITSRIRYSLDMLRLREK